MVAVTVVAEMVARRFCDWDGVGRDDGRRTRRPVPEDVRRTKEITMERTKEREEQSRLVVSCGHREVRRG